MRFKCIELRDQASFEAGVEILTIGFTQIRRFFLVVSFVLALVLGGAVYYVRSETAANNARQVTITAFTLNEKNASRIKSKFADKGYSISVKGEKHGFAKADGYSVVLEPGSGQVKALHEALLLKKNIKHYGLEVVNNGTVLRIRKKFPNEAAARKCAALIKKEDGFVFQVKANEKEVEKPGFKCVISGVPVGEVEEVRSFLESCKFEDIETKFEDKVAGT